MRLAHSGLLGATAPAPATRRRRRPRGLTLETAERGCDTARRTRSSGRLARRRGCRWPASRSSCAGRAVPLRRASSRRCATVTDRAPTARFGLRRGSSTATCELRAVAPAQGAFSPVRPRLRLPAPDARRSRRSPRGRLRITQYPAHRRRTSRLTRQDDLLPRPERRQDGPPGRARQARADRPRPLQGRRDRQARPGAWKGALPLRQLLPLLRGQRPRRPPRPAARADIDFEFRPPVVARVAGVRTGRHSRAPTSVRRYVRTRRPRRARGPSRRASRRGRPSRGTASRSRRPASCRRSCGRRGRRGSPR